MPETWIIWSLISLFSWGIWGFLPKLATRTVSTPVLFIWEIVGATIASVPVLIIFNITFHPVGAAFAFAAGAVNYIGLAFYLQALRTCPAGILCASTGLYPVFTAILALVFLGEKPSTLNIIGIALAVVAILLLNHPAKEKPSSVENLQIP